MKVSLGQKISLVCLVIGLTVLGFLANSGKIPKAEAASTTAWSISDLDDAVITTTRSGFPDGWIHEIKNSAGTTTYGDVYDNDNVYSDGGTTGGAEAVRLDITGVTDVVNIQAGDTIVLTGDGTPTNITVYLPALAGDDILWVADDGSTYYDSGLSSLAYEAPIEISISLDSTSAYDFSAIIPEQTHTTSNNVRNVTVTCNETNGWKLYVKSISNNFTSGGNSININSLEWSWNDGSPSWTDMSTTDTEVRSSSSPTSASGVETGMEYRINIDFSNTPASGYSATITYTAVCQ